MARKSKEEKVTANNLRSPHFAEFEATHSFTAESKKADFTREAIKAGLTNAEIIEIGNAIYGEDGIKPACINWYRSSDPVLNPGKERYRATGAKAIEVRNKVLGYYNDLADDEKSAFVSKLVETIGVEALINATKTDILKAAVPAELFPAKEKPVKREMSKVEKLLKKQEAAEKKAAKLREELAALQAEAAAEVSPADMA